MAALVLAVAGTAACEPQPPRVQLIVDTAADGADAVPGDGLCATSTGACSLRAAIEEGGTAPDGADVAVPAGAYGGFDATVTGDVRLLPVAQPVTITDTILAVAAGGHLALEGVNTAPDIVGDDLLDLDVTGSALVTGSVLERVRVAPGATLALTDSAVVAFTTPSAENDGILLATRSSILAHDVDGSATEPVLHTGAAATSHLVASVIAQPRLESDTGTTFAGGAGTCTGVAPTLATSSVAEVPGPCGGAGPDAPADVAYLATFGDEGQTGFQLALDGSSPLVDAIPLGDPACDTSTVDLYGNPRGVDGDGDGVGGCDVGAVERPIPTITPLLLGGPGNTVGDPAAGSWVSVHGPGTNAENGDKVNTRCLTLQNTDPCTSGPNPGYLPPSDPDSGSWYAIEAPAGGGSVTVSVFDAQFTVDASDMALQTSGAVGFATSYRVYEQLVPTDFHARTPFGPNTPDDNPGSCHWSLTEQTSFDDAWVDLCTIVTAPGETYLLNVRTAERPGFANSSGGNGFAVRACTADDCTAPDQPAVHALDRMVHHAAVETTSATFHLAEVGPEHAGSTLVIELWDPGDARGYVNVRPSMPSVAAPGAVHPVPASACEITSTAPGLPATSHLGTVSCSVRTAIGGGLRTPIYNGHAVTMRIEIPDSYTCTLGIDPRTSAGSCWWGFGYDVSEPVVDAATLRAFVVA